MKNIEKLFLTTKINDKIVDNSTLMDEKTKMASKNLSEYIRNFLEKEPNMSSYEMISLRNGLLTYWNESINPDTESFWAELKNNGIDYERKEPLKFALKQNRFRRVDQGIDARKYWNELKVRKEVIERFTKDEIKQIEKIIFEDENQRFEILRDCFKKNKIPKTKYLKFGECVEYMNKCGLWNKYFNRDEVKQLHNIWNN